MIISKYVFNTIKCISVEYIVHVIEKNIHPYWKNHVSIFLKSECIVRI